MRTAVLGAGAVGCYYGGMLARARREVVLIGRPRHVEAITRDGLYMDTLGFQEHVRVAASTEAAGVAGARMVLCCVKSTDTLQAAAEMAPHLADDVMLLSLQNGYDNAERLQAALGRPVHAAVADKIAIIYRGRILLQGTLEELKSQVLGAPEYEIKFSEAWSGDGSQMPEGVEMLSQTPTSLKVRVKRPEEMNPQILKVLSAKSASVMAFQEEARTLEQVYLKVMTEARGLRTCSIN
jgi:2-dehydropantoate 2-reductase